jgi:hypothetical protein
MQCRRVVGTGLGNSSLFWEEVVGGFDSILKDRRVRNAYDDVRVEEQI